MWLEPAAEQDQVGRRQKAEQARLSELVGNLDFLEKLLEDVVQHSFLCLITDT